jgi:uncharacterized protein (TIGR03435 family)
MVSMDGLASRLSAIVQRPIINRTGLAGTFDVDLTFAPLDAASSPDAPSVSNAPALFTALQEQLGLKLESQRGPVEVLVVDRVEQPTEN